jgi:hypothetical protein
MTTPEVTFMNNFDTSSIILQKPKDKIISPTIQYKSIGISKRYSNGRIGDLLIATPPLFSYGVDEDKSFDEVKDGESAKIKGYKLSMNLYDRYEPTDEQLQWVDKFNEMCTEMCNQILNMKDSIGQCDLEMRDFLKYGRIFNPIFYKRDKITKKVVDGAQPQLYIKLSGFFDKEHGNYVSHTDFYDDVTGNALDFMDVFQQKCMIRGIIKVDYIYVANNSIKLQLRLYEAGVTLQNNNRSRLLQPLEVQIPNTFSGSRSGSGRGDDYSEESDMSDVQSNVPSNVQQPVQPEQPEHPDREEDEDSENYLSESEPPAPVVVIPTISSTPVPDMPTDSDVKKRAPRKKKI